MVRVHTLLTMLSTLLARCVYFLRALLVTWLSTIWQTKGSEISFPFGKIFKQKGPVNVNNIQLALYSSPTS